MTQQAPLPFDAVPQAGAARLLGQALPAEAGVYDELRRSDGRLRPHWADFERWVGGTGEFDARLAALTAAIRRDGVTHNVHDAAAPGRAPARPWSLELLPLIISAAEWAQIEAGVAQRAALLEALLGDLYGERRLLQQGLLPPALLLRHPGYVRPLQGVRPAGGRWLHLVAFDLARGADGRWWLIAQRTQAPSGLGYVLHNRLLVSRQFPEAFRELRVQHVASSYRHLLDGLEAAAAEVAQRLGDGGPARIALYTPGPWSETYFEHAYLARYLGIPLVEGDDLTVRGARLWLKTVEGLQPLHGLLRRVDDDWCDPLELRPDSALGVPGLLQAVRAGAVALANAPGSAILESPALQGFLPALSEALSGQALQLPSLPTWWCGEPAAWADVRGQLDGKRVRTTFPEANRTSHLVPIDASLAEQIAADPDAFTVQGHLRFSRAPIWSRGVILARPAMVRVYAIADGGGRWRVLPGGMTRVAQREDESVSMQRGGSSLDTWVLTDGAVDTFSMLPQALTIDDLATRTRPVTSRTGENLYWLGRYTERTEQQVRLVQVLQRALDADAGSDGTLATALSELALRSGLIGPGVPSMQRAPQVFERTVLAALADENGACSSIGYHLAALERAALALRDRLAPEQWGLVRRMREEFSLALKPQPAARGGRSTPAEGGPGAPWASWSVVLPVLERLGLQLAAATGAQTDRMTRDPGWRLLASGRLVERLQGMTVRLESFLAAGAVGHVAGTDALLDLFDSTLTFRARYQHHEGLLPLTELLVLDGSNPRSLAGVLRRLRTELSKLPGQASGDLAGRLPATGTGLTLDELRGLGEAQIADCLLALARRLHATANLLAEAIGQRYFTLADGTDRMHNV